MRIHMPKNVSIRYACARSPFDGKRVPLLIASPKRGAGKAPGVLWIHGGGYLLGMKEMFFITRAADLAERYGAVVVCPGYRLSFQKPYPAALRDCYAALLYLKDNAKTLGVRGDQLVVGGESAGGGLTAAVCMEARDRGDVRVAFQLPLYPMLDDRDTETSRDNHGRVWNTARNHLGWRLYLRGVDAVTPRAAPARQTEYADLPPCYTFVGDGEPFLAETLDYVENLQKAGVPAAVRVYHTDCHAFDMMYPGRAPAPRAMEDLYAWLDTAFATYYAPQPERRG